jgi:hypothetical protein
MDSLFQRADGGANQYKVPHELQFWSCFYISRIIRYFNEGGKANALLLGWYREKFVPAY